jgi:hypothetical protein
MTYMLSAAAKRLREQLATAGAATGSAMVQHLPHGVGAQPVSLRERERGKRVSAWDFFTAAQKADIKAGTALVDVSGAINAAITEAYGASLGVVDDWVDTTPPYSARLGACLVELPTGVMRIDSPITLLQGVGIVGMGMRASVLKGTAARMVELNGSPDHYNAFGLVLEDFGIIGDRSVAGQIGLALQRAAWGEVRRVWVTHCGGHGIVIRECLATMLVGVQSHRNKGDGLRVADGTTSWTDATPTGYPTNALTRIGGHYGFNDGAGVSLACDGPIALGGANGCKFVGGALEYNHFSDPSPTGQNVRDTSASYVPNEFDAVWFEGGTVRWHIFKDSPNESNALLLNNCKHFGTGPTGPVERFARIVKGRLIDKGSNGHGDSYKSVAGSVAPYRITKATARVELIDVGGATVSAAGPWVEDENGATTGLHDNTRIGVYGQTAGPVRHTAEAGQSGIEQATQGDTHPWMRAIGSRLLQFGSGAAAPDAQAGWMAARMFGTDNDTHLRAGIGNWNGGHLAMGGYRLWVDAAGRLRIKPGVPTSDTDGTVVGVQS